MTEEKAAALTAPRIHLNGTGRTALEEQYETAIETLGKAIDALGESAPNARDYYPIEPGAFSRAMGEHASRVRRLREVQGELYWLRESLDEGENGRQQTADSRQQTASEGGAPVAKREVMQRHTYARIDASGVSSPLRWDVPPENQGQIVEVAYADDPPEPHPACSGSTYRRVTDRSDGSVTYWRRVRG